MGLYPATPDYRIAYHRDGSTGFRIDYSNNITQLTAQQLLDLQDEELTTGILTFEAVAKWGIIFPYLVDLSKFFLAWSTSDALSTATRTLETSADSTNGLDGTWTNRLSGWPIATVVKPDYRSAIQAVSAATGIIAARFTKTSVSSGGMKLAAMHLYGVAAANADPYLRLWHPTLNQALAASAFYDGTGQGDPNQGETHDVTFRVKNTHGTLTANSVTVSTEGLTGSSTAAGWILYSTGGAYAASQNLGNLGAGVISGVITGRLTVPSTAVLGQQSPRTVAAAGSWA